MVLASSNMKAQYSVSGSGDPNANGIYTEAGTYNGNPSYSNGSYNLYFKNCTTKWAIAHPGNCPVNSTASNGDVPPLDGWHTGGSSGLHHGGLIITTLNRIGIDKDLFIESLADDGTINDSIQMLLFTNGNPFTGTNGDDFVTDGKVIVSNAPIGLTTLVIRRSDSTLVVKFSGTAINHTERDNMDNLSIEFQDNAFFNNNASEIENSEIGNLSIRFMEKFLVYGATVYPQVNDTFSLCGINYGKPLYSNGTYYLFFKGCEHRTKWAISSNMGSCPLYSTNTNGDYPNVSGWHNGGGWSTGTETIYFSHLNTIHYPKTSISESVAGDGSFTDSLTVWFIAPSDGNGFTGANDDDFVLDGKVLVTNLPNGLTAQAIRTSDTTVTVKFLGNAVNNSFQNSRTNLTIEFQNSAFSNGDATLVDNYLKDDLEMVFLQKYGVIGATITPGVNGIYCSSGTFNSKPIYSKGEYRLGYRNCNAIWVLIGGDDDSRVGTGHCPLYSTSINEDTPPKDKWSSGGRGGYGNDPILVIPCNSIVYSSKSISESAANNGTISDTLALTYYFGYGGNSFTGANGDDFIVDGKILVSNLPAGITAIASRTSDTTLTIRFEGAATNHRFSDNITNLTFEFQDNAFTDGDAQMVGNYLTSDVEIIFLKKYEVFDAISTPGMNGTYTSYGLFNDKPAFSYGEYRLGYRGCTSKWVIVNGNDNTRLNRGNCPRSRTKIDGYLPPQTGWYNESVKVVAHNSLYYSKTTFNESLANDGSIDNTDTLEIRYFFPEEGVIFSGVNGDDFIEDGKILVSNLPDGLTVLATRSSDTTLMVVFTGNATHHKFSDDVTDLTFAFQNNAFSNDDATFVGNYLVNNMNIVFLMKYEVIGAISEPGMNGTYVSTDYFNSKVFYTKDEYRLGYRGCGSRWVIVNGNDYNRLNRGNCPKTKTYVDGNLPPLTGWFNEPVTVITHNSLYYNKTTFTESLTHKGSIDNSDTLVIRYLFPERSATFSGVNGDNFVADGKVSITNLPIGLTPIVTRSSDTTLRVVFTGTACPDDVANLTFAFTDNAFTGIEASEVFYSIKDDLIIDFHNEYYVASTGGDFTTIANAVSSSTVKDGDVLILAAETFTALGIYVNKSLTFRGQGAGKTIVQADATPGTATDRLFYMSFNSDNRKPVTFENMTLQNGNCNSQGGCIYSSSCNLTLSNCELTNNRTYYYYGGAVNANYGSFVAENCTFSSNSVESSPTSSSYGGGALYIYSYYSSDTAYISNCTFSGNSALNLYGGALWSYYNLKIVNSTFTNNVAYNGGGLYNNGLTINMVNVLVADNTATWAGNDIYGSVTANYCLIKDVASAGITGSNNSYGVDPELSGLTYNGGSTQTCAISNTSPAKDAGTSINAPLLDQRGVAIFNDSKDIGAYEYSNKSTIIVSDTILQFWYVPVNDTKELNYSISAFNLNHDLVITAPVGFEISGYSGSAFVGTSSITLVPAGGVISDTTIYVQCAPVTSGLIEETITNTSTSADDINVLVKAEAVYKPTGDNELLLMIENTTKTFTSDDFTFNDLDGDIFAGIKIVTQETNGELDYNGEDVINGTVCGDVSKLTFSPYFNGDGLSYATFTFLVRDNTGFYSDLTYTMTIDVNDVPIGADNNLLIDEDNNLTFAPGNFSFTNNVGNFDGISIVSVATTGTLEYDGSPVAVNTECPDVTKLVFIPSANENGTPYATFDFKVKDDLGAYSSENYTMTINVNPLTDVPEGADERIVALKNENFTFAPENFTYIDVDGDPSDGINIVLLETAGDLEYIGADVTADMDCPDVAQLVFKPGVDETGINYATFTFKVKDNTGLYSDLAYTMTIDLDDIPVGANESVSTDEDINITFAPGNFTFTNLVGNFGGISITSVETAGALEYDGVAVATGTECPDITKLIFKPASNQSGTPYASFGFKVTDDLGTHSASSYTMTINVMAINDGPIGANETVITNEDQSIPFADADFTYSDAEGDAFDGIKIVSVETAGDLEYNGIDITPDLDCPDLTKLVFKPAANENSNVYATFRFKLKDDMGSYSSAIYTMAIQVLAVNDAPEGSNDMLATSEDQNIIFASSNFTFTDVDEDTFGGINILSVSTAGALEYDGVGVAINTECPDITKLVFIPGINQNGESYATFGFKVRDSQGALSAGSYTMTINVTAVNDGPHGANETVITSEDQSKAFNLANFTYNDLEGDTFAAVKIISTETAGDLEYNGTDVTANMDCQDVTKLVFKPAANENGTAYAVYEFKLKDNLGAYSAETYMMTIDVTAVNDAPEGANDVVTTNEDENLTFAASGFTFSDVDGDAFGGISIGSVATAGVLEYDGTAVSVNTECPDVTMLVFKPEVNQLGNAYSTFAYKVKDNLGAYSSGSYTMTINVTAVNDTPEGANETITIDEDVNYTFSVSDFTYSDADDDAFNGIRVVSVETAGNLEYDGNDVIVNMNCPDVTRLVFKPSANQSGAPFSIFGFKVIDNSGVSSSETYAITFNVTAVNDAPLGANETVTINEDENLTFTPANFMFSDAEGDAFNGIKIVSAETAGDLEYDGIAVTAGMDCSDLGKLVFKPEFNQNGHHYASFEFKVSDGASESYNSYVMTINVTAVNDTPTLENEIPDQDAKAGVLFTYEVPVSIFADVDAGDVLTYSASLTDANKLPEWLGFTANILTFSGIPVEAGQIAIRVTATDLASASVSSEFILTVEPGDGVEDILFNNLSIFPNPATGVVTLSIKQFDSDMNLMVKDITGKTMINNQLLDANTKIDFSDYEKGIYLIQLVNGEKTITKKVVIQ